MISGPLKAEDLYIDIDSIEHNRSGTMRGAMILDLYYSIVRYDSAGAAKSMQNIRNCRKGCIETCLATYTNSVHTLTTNVPCVQFFFVFFLNIFLHQTCDL